MVLVLVLVLDFRAPEIGTSRVLVFCVGTGLGCVWIDKPVKQFLPAFP
jgi:hypothetical protein